MWQSCFLELRLRFKQRDHGLGLSFVSHKVGRPERNPGINLGCRLSTYHTANHRTGNFEMKWQNCGNGLCMVQVSSK